MSRKFNSVENYFSELTTMQKPTPFKSLTFVVGDSMAGKVLLVLTCLAAFAFQCFLIFVAALKIVCLHGTYVEYLLFNSSQFTLLILSRLHGRS